MKMSQPAAGAVLLGNFCGAIQIMSPSSAMAAIALRPIRTNASSLGGCDFAADPSLGWRSANAFWRPEVAADVVSFASSPANFSGGPTVADLQRFAVVTRLATDGLHLLWDDRTQLWVTGDARGEQPLVALLPLDENSARRLIATTFASNTRSLGL
ncbi:hypothetical protein KX816_02205 [Sphingosinicellaceae bacterium]|nr:hypothetical protein KX816_02205 [Sphingosinicellaceae bacterium]